MKKKAAVEISIGTIVIIVLAMSMLILGMVLVRNIMRDKAEPEVEATTCDIKTYVEFVCDDGQSGFVNSQTYGYVLNQTNCTQLNSHTACVA